MENTRKTEVCDPLQTQTTYVKTWSPWMDIQVQEEGQTVSEASQALYSLQRPKEVGKKTRKEKVFHQNRPKTMVQA